MCPAYLSLGSNSGDRIENLRGAVRYIGEFSEVISTASLYETQPWRVSGQPDYLNTACVINHCFNPYELLKRLQAVEDKFGRIRDGRYSGRTLDIDILLIDDLIINSGELTIPHPLMTERLFALIPLAEIAPEAVHPVYNKSIAQLLVECRDNHKVTIFDGDIE
ncbi:2-amino-4-hydroxy-6-hydroxymethyldihydropteridine diphosphokinase [bacterium]|nr:2-amino-4-hydroxy-6-hydroxymethyldihydropteridine diphosphokinase [bacterium]